METDKKILVVDDEETLCEVLRFNLEAAGYAVDVAYSAEEALTLDLSRYALILLDIMMGEISGVQMARILKNSKTTTSIPIIFCTAKDTEEDMVSGLDLGADDYITKPYSVKNVLARVRSVLRRTKSAIPSNESRIDNLVCGGLVVDRNKKECRLDGRVIPMPRKEFEILAMLLEHRGQVFSREQIIARIWPEEVVVLDRVVDVNITRLRTKLGDYGKHIVTRSGYGYGFME
ncbi:response regulator transcription factor [uncultured Bacteroides sp.]|uniref:response regulator transcription factor n=1 Tax=uncultured Bacteroides sp. TaxID=162156 RepID=UPI0026269570|nr:response regulator transcription factor [uncultured Bacteroides sp.]